MRLITWFAPLAVTGALSFLVASGADSGKKLQEKTWGAPTEGFRLAAWSTQKQFNPDDKIDLHITLQNTDTKDREAMFANPYAVYQIKTTRPNGKAVPMKGENDPFFDLKDYGDRWIEKLRPGQEVGDTVELGKLFDMKAVGDYLISASRLVWNRDNNKSVRVTSNTLVITIIESASKKGK